MTSKGLFFKAVREDLRHKVWMSALSALGSFLAMPVAWLLMRNNMADEMKLMRYENIYFISRIYEFFMDYYMLCGGCVAVLGAFIVGLFGFRYLFRQGMVDTYHSLPVKRSMLFGVCYADGFLIWFVPAFIGMLSTIVMAGQFAYQIGGGRELGGILREAAVSFAVLTVVFLLVYNMVLTAVMLSGNVLNALVAMVMLGFGVLAVYMLGIAFFAMYMETFYAEAFFGEKIAYFSPFFSALYLLYARCGLENRPGGLFDMLLIDLGIAAALGACAWLLYRRRASELAEQGIYNKAVSMVMRAAAGLAAGMCVSQLFVMLVLDTGAVVWGIFGAVLGTVFAFGILDVIFHMEFKAFFAHKLQMAATLALTLLLCIAFYLEWFGYDVYLPRKDEIAEIAVYDISFINRTFASVQDGPLEQMAFRDTETAYAYLEAMTAAQAVPDTERGYGQGYDRIYTKVTLKDGRSYYRNYYVTEKDWEVVWPLLSSKEYIQHAYCIGEEWTEDCKGLALTRNGESVRIGSFSPEAVARIIQAYNEDVLADPEAVLLGRGRLLVRMELLLGNERSQGTFVLDVYESMGHVLEAMEQAGYQRWTALTQADDIQFVELPLNVYAQEPVSRETVIARARDVYGVEREEGGGIDEGAAGEEDHAEYPETAAEDWVAEESGDYSIFVTDKGEVEQLLALAGYAAPYRGGNVFREDYAEIYAQDREGNKRVYYIKRGLLPEKYILRFGEGR